jgi:hypothetical protein
MPHHFPDGHVTTVGATFYTHTVDVSTLREVVDYTSLFSEVPRYPCLEQFFGATPITSVCRAVSLVGNE